VHICDDCGEKNPGTYPMCGYCGAPLVAGSPPPEIRRTVTIAISDLKGSTALGEKLDPESVFGILALYFDAMRLIFESHGGTIEKIIGDAIVAVFGLTVTGEDDALRAVRAAAETQVALGVLNEQLDRRWGVRLVNRTGIATGEVAVTASSAGEHILVGDVVRMANKLEQSAPPMEVLVGEATYRIVSDRVTVAPVGPVIPQGATVPVAAYRLVSVIPGGDTEAVPVKAAELADARICPNCGTKNPLAFRRCGSCGAHLIAKRAREIRKTVTIIFADLKAATALGEPLAPDVLKQVMARAFEASRRALAKHGATVEKFIGDAVMAVFGLPVRHEDDALRAVRSALDMRAGLTTLAESLEREQAIHLDVGIGVNTGEVVSGHASMGPRFVTGDAVNVAARLEQAARSREILIGQLTYALVRDFADVEEIAPLTLKGKSQPVRAYRLLAARLVAPARRRQDGAMVGREAEMTLLSGAFEAAVADRACRMVTLIGDAGVGKTRLTEEFLDSIGDRVRVVRGRCLPYGEGITFWPIVGVVGDAAGIEETDNPEAARDKLRQLIGDGEVADRVASAVGLFDAPFQVAELFWGIRRFFEILAKDRPLAVLFDDIHWAEQTFLDLVGRLVSATEDAPVMLLCTARQVLLDKQPSWAEGPGASRIVLTGLSDADAARLVENMLGQAGLSPRARARVVAAAEGNPLFVEQLVSMLIDTGMLRSVDGRWEPTGDLSGIEIPPTIHALLAARLDQLPEDERAVVDPASVIGLVFVQASLQAIVDEEVRSQVPIHLTALEQRQLVRRQNAEPVEDEALGYRFAHLMIRDAAYAGLLKRTRAELHERFVAWADEANRAVDRGTEFEEILGYHLEQAHRYRSELGPLDEHGVALGVDASGRLASAGRRAFVRGDMPATANLLRRAAALLPGSHVSRPRLQFQFGLALWETGEYAAAAAALDAATSGAAALHDTGLEATARLTLLMKQYYADPSKVEGRVEDRVREAIAIVERVGDQEGLARAWLAMAGLRMVDRQWGEAAKAIERVIEHARRAEDRVLELRAAPNLAICAEFGPTPVDEAISICEEIIARSGGDRKVEAIALGSLAHMHAMQGYFELAREEYRRARGMLEELGWTFTAALSSIVSGPVEMLAGDAAAAEIELRRDYETLDRLGDRNYISTIAAFLAEALYRQGRYDESATLTAFSADVASPDDLATQVLWRGVSGKLLARQGEFEEAERIAREAVEMSRRADDPIDEQANALMDLGLVLRMANKHDEASREAGQALALYEQKGNLVSAAAARQFLADGLRARPADKAPGLT
jgi:class 3 adenylate cyclase/tetratricopeptide (TPR) repeat protein